MTQIATDVLAALTTRFLVMAIPLWPPIRLLGSDRKPIESRFDSGAIQLLRDVTP
jgi:hypothetical protein